MKVLHLVGLCLVLSACGGNEPAPSTPAPESPPSGNAAMPPALVDVASVPSSSAVAPAPAAPSAAPATPDAIKVPQGNSVVAKVSAKGVQIYACSPKKDEPKQLEWALKAPEAELTSGDGKPFGKHYAGPTWEAADGSKVVGALKAKVDAPNGNAIPWLLVEAKSHNGAGALARVTFVQRVDTTGGKPPVTGCDKAHANAEARVEYTANYLFYAPGPGSKP